MEYVLNLSSDELHKTIGITKANFPYVLHKYKVAKDQRITAHQAQFNPNKAGIKPGWTPELELIILFLYFRRKYTVWDIEIFFKNPYLTADVITHLISNSSIDLDKALEGEIRIPDEPERKKLAEKYNLPEHRRIVLTFDGSLFEVKKSLDKVVQAENSCYKGYQARNVEFGVLPNGEIGSLKPSAPGSVTDITNTKYNAVWRLLNPNTEDSSFDKGYDGIQEFTNAQIPTKKRKGITRTPEEKELSNRLKKQRIIVENSINCVKQFKILKGRFPYSIEGGYYAPRFDRVVRICGSLANIHLRSHPIRTSLDISTKMAVGTVVNL